MLLTYYQDIIQLELDCARQALSEKSARIASAHQKITDLTKIFQKLGGKREKFVYESILQDLGFSLHHAVTGLYRQSYVSQRVVLENGVAALFYSAQLLELHKWVSGETSVSWTKVALSDGGVFTEEFAEAFLPDAVVFVEDYRQMAVASYARLSDFTHKRITVHAYDEAKFVFVSELLDEVIDSFENLVEIISFGFLVRYLSTTEEQDIQEVAERIDGLCGAANPFSSYISKRI